MLLSLLMLTGMLAISIVLLLIAHLSRRLGSVTHARPYYIGLYVAAGLYLIAGMLRVAFANNMIPVEMSNNRQFIFLLVDGLPALAITLALGVMWFYWSWLLAERD